MTKTIAYCSLGALFTLIAIAYKPIMAQEAHPALYGLICLALAGTVSLITAAWYR